MHPSLLYNCHSDDVTRSSNVTLAIKHFKFIACYGSVQNYPLGNNLPYRNPIYAWLVNCDDFDWF